MTQPNAVDRIRASGIIAIMRASSSDQLLAAAEAVLVVACAPSK